MAFLSFTIGGDPGVLVTVTEDSGKLKFVAEVKDTVGANDKVADLRALFFHVQNDLVSGLTVSDRYITLKNGSRIADTHSAINIDANKVANLKQGANLNGEVGLETGKMDVGVEFGSPGISSGDDVRKAEFTLSRLGGNLTLDLIKNQSFVARLTSVGTENGSRNDSLKLLGNAGSVVALPASLGDQVWIDADGDGVQDGGEIGLPGVTVQLITARGTDVLATTTTDDQGNYLFSNLTAGTYTVKFLPLNGYRLTAANVGTDTSDSDANQLSGLTGTYTLAAGDQVTSVDAGFYKPAAIGSRVWVDSNSNGQLDGDEEGRNGVTVHLLDEHGNAVLKNSMAVITQTANGGYYRFENLTPGKYTIQFNAPQGYKFTVANAGTDATDSDADAAGKTGVYDLSSGEDDETADAGLVPDAPVSPPPSAASLGAKVWVDDGDGVQEDGENGFANVTVELRDATGAIVLETTTTNSQGNYLFNNLSAGTYTVKFLPPTGYHLTTADVGFNTPASDLVDSDASQTGLTGTYTLAAGDSVVNVDAGLVVDPLVNPPPPPPGPPGKYDDLIEAGDGNDVIYSGQGNDEVQGEGGNDHITGGTDEGKLARDGMGRLSVAIGDNLYGNDGKDTYHYAAGDGVDMIWDFRPGEDIINLTGIDPSQVKLTAIGGLTNWIGTGAHNKVTLIFGNDQGAVVFNDFPGPAAGHAILRFGNQTLTWADLLTRTQATTGGAAIAGHTPDLPVIPLTGSNSDNEISGGNGNNIIVGAGSVDRFYGNEGYNWLEGLAGNDQLFGGNQSDVLLGGEGQDRLYGNEGANWLEGDAGQDQLYGGNHQDVLLAGREKDLVFGNGGNDLIVGGEGSDKLYGAGGEDTIYGDDAEDLLLSRPAKPHAGINEVYTIKGSATANRVIGSAADEIIKGLGGNDKINAGDGDDWVEGDKGNDILTGGKGSSSDDIFVFDTALGKGNVDRITDFEKKYDQVFLDDAFFKGLVKGTKDGTTIKKGMFVANNNGTATSDDAQIVYEKDTGKLFYDKDGKGGAAAAHFATLAPRLTLTFSDVEIM